MLVCLAFLNTQYFNVMIKSLLANYLLLQDDAELTFPIKVVKLDQKCTSLLINFCYIVRQSLEINGCSAFRSYSVSPLVHLSHIIHKLAVNWTIKMHVEYEHQPRDPTLCFFTAKT